MALYTQLASHAFAAGSTADVPFSVPAGEAWVVQSITIMQLAAGGAKDLIVAVGGTTATASNVRQRYPIAAGAVNRTEYPLFGVPAGSSLNVALSVAAATLGDFTITVNGFKQKTV